MKHKLNPLHQTLAVILAGCMATPAFASSHMDAPLAILDPAANTTDVYAFVRLVGTNKVLVTALGTYPHQEPGIGPNKYNFDDNVLYEIHVCLGADVAAGRPTLSYQYQFRTAYKTRGTILQAYLGVIQNIDDANQNLTQSYTVTKWDRRDNSRVVLGRGLVPPNNQGIATPYYNQGDNGNNPAKDGRSTAAEFDRYTQQAITNFPGGYRSFAGQRDDSFYADIGAIFDLLQLRSPGKDSQGGYNLNLLSLAIPVSDFGGDQQTVGVYASTSRRQTTIIRDGTLSGNGVCDPGGAPLRAGRWVQVARQGNPLFCEGLVAIADKDLYSRTQPSVDNVLFRKYAETPELAKLINLIVFGGTNNVAIETNRTDIAGIFIPDVIKVDLSTGPVRVKGSGPNHPVNPDDAGWSRLSIFGNDTLTSTIQPGFGNGTVPGGWPNGRRFGDDVVDIAVTALISDLRGPLVIRVADGIDGVSDNDMGSNKVFPYAPTPQNGRNHSHP